MSEIDINLVSDLTRSRLTDLCKRIYNKNLEEVDSEELEALIVMDMAVSIKELTVTASETRKTERDYCTNMYNASMTLDISDSVITALLPERTSSNETLDIYFRRKKAFYDVVKVKLMAAEEFLRAALREQQAKDNIAGQGRYANK